MWTWAHVEVLHKLAAKSTELNRQTILFPVFQIHLKDGEAAAAAAFKFAFVKNFLTHRSLRGLV